MPKTNLNVGRTAQQCGYMGNAYERRTDIFEISGRRTDRDDGAIEEEQDEQETTSGGFISNELIGNGGLKNSKLVC